MLATGLGLGCVVRGLLINPDVDHIDVIELDHRLIRIVGAEFAGNPRVTLHHGNALKVPLDGHWDFAWHDICAHGGTGLQALHTKLMMRWFDRVTVQGAWGYPRCIRRVIRRRSPGRFL